MIAYHTLADLYDHWTRNFSYDRVSDFIEHRLGHDVRDVEVLDVCCGTGTLAIILGRRGARVTGIDSSARMVEIASAKVRDAGLSDAVKIRQADATTSVLSNGKFDVALSTFDSMNYLNPENLTAALSAIALALRSGGMFIFDMNSRHKLQNVFGNTTYAEEFPDYRYVWRNKLDATKGFIDFEIEVFREKQRDGKYAYRDIETHRQFIYDLHDVVSHLEGAGFWEIQSSDDYSVSPPKSDSLRITLTGKVSR